MRASGENRGSLAMSEQTLPTNFTNYEIVESRRGVAHDEPETLPLAGREIAVGQRADFSSVEVKADGVLPNPANLELASCRNWKRRRHSAIGHVRGVRRNHIFHDTSHISCMRRLPTCSGKREFSLSDEIVTAYAFTRCSPVELKAISAVNSMTVITHDFDRDVSGEGLLRSYVNRRNGLPFLGPYQLSPLESPGAVHRFPLGRRGAAVEVVSEQNGRIGTTNSAGMPKVPMPAAQDASNISLRDIGIDRVVI